MTLCRCCYCVLILLSVVTTGCVRLPSFTPPVDALLLHDAHARCQELQHPDTELQSLRALIHVTLQGGSENATFRYAVIARQPDAFRVDLLPDTGAFTLGMLVSSGGMTTILDTHERSFVRGSDESKLIESFLRIPGFSRDVVLASVAGTLPRLACNGVVIRARPGGELLIEDRERMVVWYYDSLTRTVQGVTGTTPDFTQVRYEVRRTGEDPESAVISLLLHDPVEATVMMELQKLTVNGKIGDELFRVAIPGGYRDRS